MIASAMAPMRAALCLLALGSAIAVPASAGPISPRPDIARQVQIRHEANVFARPAGKTYDFRECPNNPKAVEYAVCKATGVIMCDGRVVGSGSVMRVAERARDVILVAAHSSVHKTNNRPHQNCLFYPDRGEMDAVPIVAWYVMNDRPWEKDGRGREGRHDIGVAVLDQWISHKVGALSWLVLTDEDVSAERRRGARFLLTGFHGSKGKVLISDDCSPLLNASPFVHPHVSEEFKHDCNAVGGFSGGPLVLLRGESPYVICVHTISIGDERHSPGQAFNPGLNPNGCMRITPDVSDLIEKIAKSETLPKAGEVASGRRPPR